MPLPVGVGMELRGEGHCGQAEARRGGQERKRVWALPDGVAFRNWGSGFQSQGSENYLSDHFLNSLPDGTKLVPGQIHQDLIQCTHHGCFRASGLSSLTWQKEDEYKLG